MYKITQKRNIWFIISAIVIIPGVVALCMGGLKFGIDFTGGSLIQIDFPSNRPAPDTISQSIKDLNLGEVTIQPSGEKTIAIRLKSIDQEMYQKILDTIKLQNPDATEVSFDTIGPTFGRELRNKAISGTVMVLIFILLYIMFAFRKTSFGVVKSWVFGTGAIIALMHDILFVVGFFAILGKFWHVEINTLFITALLTVLGFSVHDTIVVYDRIREHLKISYNKLFVDIVNESINQTLVRSLNTTLTTLLVLLALYLFGGQSIQYFVLALLIGITAGTYSSIFIASPLLVVWHNFASKRK
jgi:preprotein translocase subunit SecF